MAGGTEISDIKTELATAVGLVALGDVSLHEAAEETGVSRWEIEDALEKAALAEPLGVELDGDVAAEIDKLLDDHY
ncbi:hypothetical protein [Salinibaculum salinum]|uniref:hypothetical protein n=1 Tax=Salinibaculum salinum TaxID=3131996 RepID=UPI0030EDFE1E